MRPLFSVFRLFNSRSLAKPVMARNGSSAAVPDDVLFNVKNGVGIVTMNRSKAMNALNLSMVRKIYPKLTEWQDQVKAFQSTTHSSSFLISIWFRLNL
jgi:hypothetical protein